MTPPRGSKGPRSGNRKPGGASKGSRGSEESSRGRGGSGSPRREDGRPQKGSDGPRGGPGGASRPVGASRPGGQGGRPAGNRRLSRREEAERARPVGVEELKSRLENRGFKLTEEELEKLATFHRLLIERNRSINVTRIFNLDDIVDKHYVDCLIIQRFVPNLPEPLLDIGTGGGFPGIPLKIVNPDLHIILGEGVRKRVDFLRDVRDELKLEKLDIIGRNIDKDFEYPVSGVITRAVESVTDTLKRSKNCLVPGGHVYFMKGPNVDEEMEEAEKRLGSLYQLADDFPYQLPGTPYRRRLVVYRKLAPPTQDKP